MCICNDENAIKELSRQPVHSTHFLSSAISNYVLFDTKNIMENICMLD